MKIKRYKKAERFMSLYKNNFGFREPYQVLLDGTFCQVALVHKVNLQDQLPRYLSGQCKLLTTACVIEETKRLGKPLHGAYTILSQYPIHDCGHEKPVSAARCLSSFIIDSHNRDHYLVATQDHQLRLKLSKLTICPLIKLANNALSLEKPPDKIQRKVERKHHYLANKMTDEDRKNLDDLKKQEFPDKQVDPVKKKAKRKGPKGPNPLSCKKKSAQQAKPSNDTKESQNDEAPRKRRRKKVRIARHVKKLLQENANVSD